MSSRHRLSGRGRIGRIRERGVSVRADGLRARVEPGRSASARAAVGVTRAVNAVERNRARRRVRAVLGEMLPALPAVDLVLTVPRDAATMPFAELQRRVERCLAAAAVAVQPT